MALIIVKSTGLFQVRWNVLSLLFSERESGKLLLGLCDSYHNYLISNNCIQYSGNKFLHNNITFFAGFDCINLQ